MVNCPCASDRWLQRVYLEPAGRPSCRLRLVIGGLRLSSKQGLRVRRSTPRVSRRIAASTDISDLEATGNRPHSPGPFSPGHITGLQRTIGNQATGQMVARALAGRGAVNTNLIHRWPTDTPTLDFTKTKTMTPLMSGQAVLFVKDATDPPVVIKSEDAPFGATLLSAFMHRQLHGTPTIRTTDGTPDKQTFIDLIENPAIGPTDKWDALGNAKDAGSWIVPRIEYDMTTGQPRDTRGNTPEQKARFFMADQFRSKPKVQVMMVATGQSTRKMAQQDKTITQGVSRYRAALSDPAYVRKLGELTAADYFLENGDRATANFGNFMTDANNAIQLIDNMDANAQALWQSDDVIGARTHLDQLAPSKTDALVKTFLWNVVNEVKFGEKGGDVQIKAWLKEAGQGGTREDAIKTQFAAGLDSGRARIIKLYATNKSGKEGRKAKKAAKEAYKIDSRAGDAGAIPYWERLKARARYLKSLK